MKELANNNDYKFMYYTLECEVKYRLKSGRSITAYIPEIKTKDKNILNDSCKIVELATSNIKKNLYYLTWDKVKCKINIVRADKRNKLFSKYIKTKVMYSMI